jgi:cholesterol oxidase
MNGDRSHRWLSRGAEVLIEEIESRPDSLHCDVLIVGSGYGGAVAAARLAGARPKAGGDPVRVMVLERGNEYLPGEFPATFAELPGHVRFSGQDGQPARGHATGLFDLRLGKYVSVLLGNGLGGGSLINAAVMEPPCDHAFAPGLWPECIDATTLAPFYRDALAMLEPETIPGMPAKLESLLAAGKAMHAWEARKAYAAVAFRDGKSKAGVELKKCLECGDCVTGCNHRAKKTLDVNYLALAQAKGAQLYCGGTVHCILQLADQAGYGVEFFLTDPQKARSDTAL